MEDFRKKGYKIDVEEALKKAEVKKEQLPMMHSEHNLGGYESFLAILKMAVSQYIEKRDDIANVRAAIEDIKNPPNDLRHLDKVELCVLENEIFSVDDDEVSHSIFLNASNEKHKLYAIIQLFNTPQYIVKLSDTYDGQDFTDLYVYDVLKKNELKKEILWFPDFDFVFDFKYPKSAPNFSIMQERMTRVIKIAMKKKEERWRSDIIKKISERLIEKIKLHFENGNSLLKFEINNICEELITEYLLKETN